MRILKDFIVWVFVCSLFVQYSIQNVSLAIYYLDTHCVVSAIAFDSTEIQESYHGQIVCFHGNQKMHCRVPVLVYILTLSMSYLV